MKAYKTLLVFFLILFSFSCSSDLDFDQANDIELRPVVIGNLASFDLVANQFVNNGLEQTVSIDTPELGVFDDTFFKKNLIQTDLFFEVDNTINRAFELQLFFLDNANAPVSSIRMDIPAYAGTSNVTKRTVVYQGANLDLLKQSKKIAFVITLLPGPPLSAASVGNLKLRSSITAYFDIK
ncbi:hypothetical protein BXU11_09675 [Flavobacterium sp. LM5]|uniref:hypothetical protein n=1 Tax=Flavobacterium sp. LM5 TaxID=1938610 RepID=UPI000992D936|nr:hypothetical protein [Flavobacterium sp. LM5]OOV27716.1 hypothetical protein BXU11_09675 [Flavobacterium sp. LM5]